MIDRSVYDVVVSRDGFSGLGIIEFDSQDRRSTANPFALFIYFTVRLVPQESESRIAVSIDFSLSRRLEQIPLGIPATKEETLEQLSLYAIGQYLDTSGMPSLNPSRTQPIVIDTERAIGLLHDWRRPQAPDTDVFAYAAAKIFWGWRFGLTHIRFSIADHLRLGIPHGDIERVALAGDNDYWTRIEGQPSAFSPTGKLIRDFHAGRVPGLERSPVIQVQAKLGAPRYAAAAENFSKATNFLTGPNQDLPNSVKEATMAVESLAMLVTGRDKGTLGDCIKDLRAPGYLSPPLDRLFEVLWGYSSSEPGVRHGKSSPPSLAEHEATFVVNIAASAILFLLDLDR